MGDQNERIRRNLESKTTEELQRIFKERDSSQWSDDAFEAIRSILQDRSSPEQEADFEVKCPKCGTEWELSKEEFQKNQFTCSECSATFNIAECVSKKTEEAPPWLLKRYKDAYNVAGVTSGVGSIFKVLGVLLGVGVILMGLALSSQMGILVAIPTAVGGVVSGGIFFLLGVLISAIGQIQKAVLDTAVNTSPIMSDGEKLEVISN